MNDDYISEGKALNELYDDDYFLQEYSLNRLNDAYDQLTTQMHEAKHAEVGATIKCAQCGKRIVKKTYNKVFCSNAKTDGRKNCKDRYHNRINALKGHIALLDWENSNVQ